MRIAAAVAALLSLSSAPVSAASQTAGELLSAKGACPLRHTDVKAEVSGFLARVTVTQEFTNPFSEKIEAVYTFPLPHDAAVDRMTMLVGGRTVRGRIKRREEARALYEAARTSGRRAALLDQERPNIFTQSVANILPGDEVKIEISYVETLKYEAGTYEFVFPMVVGPRYIPGNAAGRQAGGWSPDTDRVPDASRITPPVAVPGTRAGHDIDVSVTLDAGVTLDSIACTTHEVDLERSNPHAASVTLRDKATLPNKDFILRWDVAGRKISDAVLTHRAARGGFFCLILQPPERVAAADISPKELVFVLDTSGSMSGFPIEKAKEAMRLAIAGLNPQDTFNLITFSGETIILFPEPAPATSENLRRAQEFLAGRHGSGGTEMMKAIRAALEPSEAGDHVRVVCFMTDGFVGNDMEILAEVKKYSNARVFAFGIGSSTNRFLLDNMARLGRGEVDYVGLNDNGSEAARRFHERVRTPLLTDISVDWGGLPVTDVYPRRIPDLFSAKPLVIEGRYSRPAHGTIRLRGRVGGHEFTRAIEVNLPQAEDRHDVLAPLWARARIEDLMAQDWAGAQGGTMRADLREAVTQLGLDYALMTQFTSFVAVEEVAVTEGGEPRRIEVPVEIPEGVSYEGVFGSEPLVMAMSKAAPAGVARVRVGGAVTYSTPMGAPQPARMEVADAEQRRAVQQPASKLAPALAALVKNPQGPLVRDGKVRVQVFLNDDSAATIAALKALGFEVLAQPKTAKLVIGRIAPAKLEALAKLAAVRYVAPAA